MSHPEFALGDRPPAVSASSIAQSQIGLNQAFLGSNVCRRTPGQSVYISKNANVYLCLGELPNQLHHLPRRGHPAMSGAVSNWPSKPNYWPEITRADLDLSVDASSSANA